MTPPIREELLLDSDWKFHLGDIDSPIPNKHISAYMANKAGWAGGAFSRSYDDSDWRTLDIPHDWSIEGTFDPTNHLDAGFLPRGIAFYRRHFRLEESDRGKYLALRFDAVATHCTVAVNGHILHRNFCGYTPFTIPISDVANYGDELNAVAVRVDATYMEGWWYEGAGIYRDVWLIKSAPVHIAPLGVFVCPQRQPDRWETKIQTVIANETDYPSQCQLRWIIIDPSNRPCAQASASIDIPPRSTATAAASVPVVNPALWSIDHPHLYHLRTLLACNDQPADEQATPFGFRTIRFDPNEGFFLNDQPLKLNGTCNHQDHAGVGVALPDSIHEFRIRRLKAMGSNAIRCAHNPPATALLDACDRLGMLVIDENRNFGSSPEHISQLQTMVRRDRNHPSIILWSICNEEAIQGTPPGASIARAMQAAVKQLDLSRPVTAAVSGGILNEDGIATAVELLGINYQLPLHDQFHARHPNVPLIASETHCVLATRGAYQNSDSEKTFVPNDTHVASWGATARESLQYLSARPFIAGLFAWTGFDYRGEPTPHEWPCINSHFGILDTCGFAKDAFYLHKAFFTSDPFIHLFPHWNWPGREEKNFTIEAYTNCHAVQLFLNGKSHGKIQVDQSHAAKWQIPCQPGQLRALGYRGEVQICESLLETTGAPVSLGLEIHPDFDASRIPADGRFACPITVFALDAHSRRVPTAGDFVTFTLQGPAKILGVGNGNPTCHEPDKAAARSLFNGLAQIILQTTSTPGSITLTASAPHLEPASLQLTSSPSARASVPAAHMKYLISDWRMSPITASRPDLHNPQLDQDMNSWDRIDPARGPQPLWNQQSGYALYRAKLRLPKMMHRAGAILRFTQITGVAEVFSNGAPIAEKPHPHASPLSVQIPATSEESQLAVLLYAQASPAGITGPIELLPKL